MDEVMAKLLDDDFDGYLRNVPPSEVEMQIAPRMKEWATLITNENGRQVLKLMGRAHGHPEIEDGENMRTGRLVWVDPHMRWARATDRLWRLDYAEDSQPTGN
ncbi:hypothetical protein IP86_02890 [Rhodopseudomonas sp. AAP120]|uniref:Uncharacterized protein n=1 Tax=Rhodopseudomonas palustris (strain BisB5) TaxID=316057 RepID=Q138Y3_RHOPS|nr:MULTISPECIES: hypothetical protein [Rhodopseudomonas]ABE39356.1 hypothetical protein RPD_2121 [Rhodopseudomonas palustris BisB5]ACF00792.1 hypothetical protein Rpal_2271 [Rhodopseudomonas palustris TIE-1]KPG01773.1 hypothetical protein IP86_02890 [Rhodopseudomonas sp. AAP120]